MNKERRKAIVANIKAIELTIQDILSDEVDAYENMPENLQASMRGMDSEDAQENLESAIEALEEAISYLEDIC